MRVTLHAAMLVVVAVVATRAVACKRAAPIGGACSSAINCAESAGRCFKAPGSDEGVCSKTCASDADCGDLARCQSTEVTRSGGMSPAPVTSPEKWCLPKK